MKKNWWKWLGIVLVAYSLVGGLMLPLKMGITGFRVQNQSAQIVSNTNNSVEIDIYNYGPSIKVDQVVLKKDSFYIEGSDLKWNAEGTISCNFKPVFGANGQQKRGLYDLFVYANSTWMAYPNAVSIEKSETDTQTIAPVPVKLIQGKQEKDFMKNFPNRTQLYESVRNLVFHVPMWFTMIFILLLSAIAGIKYLYLNKGNLNDDFWSESLIKVAILAGLVGCATGAIWAKATWLTYWPRDPKLNGVAIGMLMYFAYLILRANIKDEHQKARISAVYNLFIFPIFISLIYFMPKLAEGSHHPGAGGSATFKDYDLDNTLRAIFYPAILGWILIFLWMARLKYRYKKLEYKALEEQQ